MTRASLFLFFDDKVISSTEFNGDGYPSGKGMTYMKIMELTKNEDDFKTLLEKFNGLNFGYKEPLTYKHNLSQYFNDKVKKQKVVNLKKGYYDNFFSDWIFIKNLSSEIIPYVTRAEDDKDEKPNRIAFLRPNEQIALNFGYKEESFTSVEDGLITHKLKIDEVWNKDWDKLFGKRNETEQIPVHS